MSIDISAHEEEVPQQIKKQKKKGPKTKNVSPKVEGSQIIEEEEPSADENIPVFENPIQKPFSDKEFSKAMSKIKDRVNGTQPPKRPSSAYILYQKEVSSSFLNNANL